ITNDGHGSALHELDARHLGSVTLAVAGLEDARVPTRARGEPRPDFLEQLVGNLALLHVPHCEPAVVQGAGLRLGYELLDERTQLLGFGLGGLDRLVLYERAREAAHESELLLARAPQLPPGFAMTHGCYSSSSSGAFSAARLGGVPQSRMRTPSPLSSYRIPKFKPSRSGRSAVSWSDVLPKFFTCKIWLSVCRTRSPSVRMLEFFSEFTERTESSRSSIGVRSTSASLIASALA